MWTPPKAPPAPGSRAAGRGDFRATQDTHFRRADAAHFRWTTCDPAFAPVEDALLAPYLERLPFPCLEVGCGEGTNLARLARRGMPIGVDRYVEKARFAATAVPAARLLAADAAALPFRGAVFASVLVRDLLHHLEHPAAALAEVARVLRPGGTLLLLEPNGRNPLIALQAFLVPAERGIRRFSPAFVAELLAAHPFDAVELAPAQGFPLRRLVLHYRFGIPALGRRPRAQRLLARLERLGADLVPRDRWSYVVATATRR